MPAASTTPTARTNVDRTRWVRRHKTDFHPVTKVAAAAATAGFLFLLTVVPQGETARGLWGEGQYDPQTEQYEFVHDPDPAFAWGMGLGVASGYLLLASPLLAYKWPVRAFLPPRWRTKLHVGAGVLVLVLALAHAVLLFAVGAFESWPTGLASLLLLAAHGTSGAFKTRLVPRWGARRWRSLHVGSAWTALAAALVHSLLL